MNGFDNKNLKLFEQTIENSIRTSRKKLKLKCFKTNVNENVFKFNKK